MNSQNRGEVSSLAFLLVTMNSPQPVRATVCPLLDEIRARPFRKIPFTGINHGEDGGKEM
jgi:hypothetical protein